MASLILEYALRARRSDPMTTEKVNINADDFSPAYIDLSEQETTSSSNPVGFRAGWRRLCKNKGAIVSLVILIVLAVLALIGPHLTHYTYYQTY